MDLIRAAPEMQRYRLNMRPVAGNLRQFAVHIIADPNREVDVDDDEGDREDDNRPKPPPPRERLPPLEFLPPTGRMHRLFPKGAKTAVARALKWRVSAAFPP